MAVFWGAKKTWAHLTVPIRRFCLLEMFAVVNSLVYNNLREVYKNELKKGPTHWINEVATMKDAEGEESGHCPVFITAGNGSRGMWTR